ncbi:MAG: hypothetical protein ABIS20_09305, partial [Thermoanaerobaculia bacterium]
AGAAASMLCRSGSGHAPAYGLLYPLDALLLAGVLLLGVLDRRQGKRVSWKGRTLTPAPSPVPTLPPSPGEGNPHPK